MGIGDLGMRISPEPLVTHTVPNPLVRFSTDFLTVVLVLDFNFDTPAGSVLVCVSCENLWSTGTGMGTSTGKGKTPKK